MREIHRWWKSESLRAGTSLVRSAVAIPPPRHRAIRSVIGQNCARFFGQKGDRRSNSVPSNNEYSMVTQPNKLHLDAFGSFGHENSWHLCDAGSLHSLTFFLLRSQTSTGLGLQLISLGSSKMGAKCMTVWFIQWANCGKWQMEYTEYTHVYLVLVGICRDDDRHFIGFWGCRRQKKLLSLLDGLELFLRRKAWFARQRDNMRQPKPLRLQGQSTYHGYHGFQLKWMTTTWSLRTFLKCAFHGFSRPSMHFSGWMWAVHGSPAVPSGLLVVLYLLVKAPLPKITGHGSHYISLAAGPPFGDTDTWWSTYGSSLQIPHRSKSWDPFVTKNICLVHPEIESCGEWVKTLVPLVNPKNSW